MTVAMLMDRQVDRVVNLARRLSSSRGGDMEAFRLLRRQVSGELINHRSNEITLAALSELSAEPGAAQWLRHIQEHCGQFFYKEDRVLQMITVPVAVNLRRQGAAKCSVSLGKPQEMSLLEDRIQDAIKATKVVFDRRMYRVEDLASVDPLRMYAYACALEAEEGVIEPIANPVTLVANGTDDWEMVYFVGVASSEPDAGLTVEDAPVAKFLNAMCVHAGFAISCSREVEWLQGVDCEAKAHGVWYLRNGLRVGEAALRAYKLKVFIANFEQGVHEVDFAFTVAPDRSHIRLLVASSVMTAEFRWPLHAGETIEPFRKALADAKDEMVPDVGFEREMDMEAYERMAKRKGLTWEGN